MTTTTDLAVPQQGGTLALPLATESLSAVVERYASDLQHCAAFAEAIVDTPFVPAALWPAPVIQRGEEWVTLKASGRDGWDFRRRHPRETEEAFAWRRGNAKATTAAIIYSGATLELNWQAALSGIYVANGRTSLYAAQIRALILSKGHTFDVLERGDEVCRISVKRRDEARSTEFQFTMAQAVRAGYVQGKGKNTGNDSWRGNDKYNTDPPAMLFARATTIAAEAKFPDVVRGMVARETLDDERPEPVEVRAEVVEPAEPPRARAAAVLAAAVQAPEPVTSAPAPERTTPAPEAAPVVQQPPTPAPASAPINKQQWDAINARFAEIGVRGKDQQAARLVVMRAILHVPGLVSKDLTAVQAQTILEDLEGDRGVRLVAHVLTEDGAPAHLIPVVPEQHDETPSEPADDREAADPGYLEDAAAEESAAGTEADPGAIEDAFPAEVPVEEPPAEPAGWQQ